MSRSVADIVASSDESGAPDYRKQSNRPSWRWRAVRAVRDPHLPMSNACSIVHMFEERGADMRWDSLRIIDDGGRPDLPLIERTAVTRTFDTPEFKGVTFYEIHAKSIINKVPAASRVPFSRTINPYRGCGHACVLLLCQKDTPVPRSRYGARLRLEDRGEGQRSRAGT
jgi:hypothetical protein